MFDFEINLPGDRFIGCADCDGGCAATGCCVGVGTVFSLSEIQPLSIWNERDCVTLRLEIFQKTIKSLCQSTYTSVSCCIVFFCGGGAVCWRL